MIFEVTSPYIQLNPTISNTQGERKKVRDSGVFEITELDSTVLRYTTYIPQAKITVGSEICEGCLTLRASLSALRFPKIIAPSGQCLRFTK